VADRVCLYALVAGADGPLRATGIAGERLRAARVGGIDAVIGVVPRPPKPTVAVMRKYDEIERKLMAIYASVLPARFGTCAATLDELAESVRDRRATIHRNLRLVRGRVQMTVRLFTSSESTPNRFRVGPEPVQSRLRTRSESSTNSFRVGPEPVQSRLRTGSEYGDEATQGTEFLRRRMAETEIPGAARLRPAVVRWVRAERSQRHSGGQLAGTLYHLVPRSAVPAYRRAISRAALDEGLTTIVSGPWPPYAFADMDT
jgi:hypothetical protein